METKVIKHTTKSGRVSYQYFVEGILVRTSNRVYVASTCNGEFFWGLPDLVGKGDFTKMIEKIRIMKSRTFDDIYQFRLNTLKRDQKSLKYYMTDEYVSWLKRVCGHLCRTEEQILAEQQDSINKAEQWVATDLKNLEVQEVNKELNDQHDWAKTKETEMSIVWYDVTGL